MCFTESCSSPPPPQALQFPCLHTAPKLCNFQAAHQLMNQILLRIMVFPAGNLNIFVNQILWTGKLTTSSVQVWLLRRPTPKASKFVRECYLYLTNAAQYDYFCFEYLPLDFPYLNFFMFPWSMLHSYIGKLISYLFPIHLSRCLIHGSWMKEERWVCVADPSLLRLLNDYWFLFH